MKGTKTKPIGTGTENLTINMPKALKTAIQELAKESDGMKIGAYCRRVLEDAAKKKMKFRVIIDDDTHRL